MPRKGLLEWVTLPHVSPWMLGRDAVLGDRHPETPPLLWGYPPNGATHSYTRGFTKRCRGPGRRGPWQPAPRGARQNTRRFMDTECGQRPLPALRLRQERPRPRGHGSRSHRGASPLTGPRGPRPGAPLTISDVGASFRMSPEPPVSKQK